MTYDGQVKLMDFGVAQSAAAAHNTRPGVIKGKLAYMAPDYFRNAGVVDRRADVFSVGVMLWELLAGHRLWQGMGEAHIVHHLAAGMLIPNLPPEPGRPPVLDRICARALTINPADRYATAADLESDLRGVLAGVPQLHPRGLGDVRRERVFGGARRARGADRARAGRRQVARAGACAPVGARHRNLAADRGRQLRRDGRRPGCSAAPREPPPPPPAAAPRKRRRRRHHHRPGRGGAGAGRGGREAATAVVAGGRGSRRPRPVVPATHAERDRHPAGPSPSAAPVAAVDPIPSLPSPPPPPTGRATGGRRAAARGPRAARG